MKEQYSPYTETNRMLSNAIECQISEMELFPLQRWPQNLAKHRRWIFLRKQSKTKSRSLYLQKLTSWMFDKVLNMFLNWHPKLRMFHF